MKNKLQIVLAILAVAVLNIGAVYAQSLQLVSAEDTFSTQIPINKKSHAIIKNISNTALQLKISVSPVSMAEGQYFQVCAGVNCYFPTNKDFTIATPFGLAAGQTLDDHDTYAAIVLDQDNDFDGVSDAKPGVSILKVRYFNIANENDYVEYTVTFTVTAASGVVSETWVRNADVFPNPTSEKVVIRLNKLLNNNSTLKVYNAAGNLVLTNELSAGSANYDVNTNELVSGNYQFTIESSDKVINGGSFTVVK